MKDKSLSSNKMKWDDIHYHWEVDRSFMYVTCFILQYIWFQKIWEKMERKDERKSEKRKK